MLGVFLTAAYMVVKGKIIVTALKLWRVAFYKLLQSTRYGEPATPSCCTILQVRPAAQPGPGEGHRRLLPHLSGFLPGIKHSH